MLETLRQFAAMALAEAQESVAARDAHLRYCLDLAEEAARELVGVTAAVIRRLAPDQDNFRAASDWAIAGADTAAALTLAHAHTWLLNLRGRYPEAADCLHRSL